MYVLSKYEFDIYSDEESESNGKVEEDDANKENGVRLNVVFETVFSKCSVSVNYLQKENYELIEYLSCILYQRSLDL